MSTIRRRLDDLQAARARQTQRKGTLTFVDEIREMLQGIDGQAELGTLPGEDLMDVMMRRMETVEGYSLSLMPGDTLKQKRKNVEEAYYGRLAVSAEARHAARKYFQLFDYL